MHRSPFTSNYLRMVLLSIDRISIASIYATVLALFVLFFPWIGVPYEYHKNSKSQPFETDKRHAAVYAGREFHDEVTCSMACTLHDMGFSVTVYYYTNFVVRGFSVPLSDNRLTNSKSYFGRCVDKWVSTTPFTTLIYDFHLLVFVSYPMKMDHHSIDRAAFSLIKQIQTKSLSTKVVLVTHQAKENIWKHATSIEQYISPNQLVFLFLSEHTYNTAVELQHQLGLTYNLSYLYPIVPLRMLFTHDLSTQFDYYFTNTTHTPPIFAIQGHFGGSHTKRRNVNATLACLHHVTKELFEPTNNAMTEKSVSRHDIPHPKLTLVGRVSGDLNLELPINSSIQLSITNELSPLAFHQAIAASHYLVTSLGSDLYLHRQATSTISTALILQTPIVTITHLLRLYPCLREAPLHRLFTHETECETIQHVLQLSFEDYTRARKEVANCSAVLWAEAKRTINAILHN